MDFEGAGTVGVGTGDICRPWFRRPSSTPYCSSAEARLETPRGSWRKRRSAPWIRGDSISQTVCCSPGNTQAQENGWGEDVLHIHRHRTDNINGQRSAAATKQTASCRSNGLHHYYFMFGSLCLMSYIRCTVYQNYRLRHQAS
ncbi:hypothetical protein QTP88_013047 [Uroleucon formosanum]